MNTLAALLTPTIAAAVGVIAFLQWRTAHQKVMLDLFDRRYRVFQTVREGISDFSQAASADESLHAFFKLHNLMGETRFLFGEEVGVCIQSIADDMRRARLLRLQIAQVPDGSISKQTEDLIGLETRILDALPKLADLLSPYMRMDQKRVRTPREWFYDRNEMRKSYGEHQP